MYVIIANLTQKHEFKIQDTMKMHVECWLQIIIYIVILYSNIYLFWGLYAHGDW